MEVFIMKKSISIIAGGLMVMSSLFGCATGPTRAYPTATPAGNNPRTTVTHAPYHAAPRATAAPRTTTMPRNLVPNINTMPGTMTTPNITPYGHGNQTTPRSGMTTTPRSGMTTTPRTGQGTEVAPRTDTTHRGTHTRRHATHHRGRTADRSRTATHHRAATHRGVTHAMPGTAAR